MINRRNGAQMKSSTPVVAQPQVVSQQASQIPAMRHAPRHLRTVRKAKWSGEMSKFMNTASGTVVGDGTKCSKPAKKRRYAWNSIRIFFLPAQFGADCCWMYGRGPVTYLVFRIIGNLLLA